MNNGSGTSAQNSEVLCDPCKHDGVNLLAEGYCKNCEEYLCKDCYQVHCRPSVTRHHVLQEKDSMPRTRTTKLEICPVHTRQSIEFYCEAHEEVCCAKCRSTSHGKCENVKLINDILSETDMRTEYSVLQNKAQILVWDIDKTQQLVQTNQKAIAINHDNCRGEMDTLRKAVKKHIDEIENELNKKLKAIRNEDEEKITSYKNTCRAMHFDINAMEAYIQGRMSGSNKYDLFIAMKNAQSKIKSNHNDLQRIRENKIRRYIFTPEPEMSKLRSYPSSFGTYSIKDKVIKSSRFVTNINVKSNKDTQTCYITGLAVISESLLAIADNRNKTIKLINIEINKITAETILCSPPWDITTTADDKLIVTLPEKGRIQFISISMPNGSAVSLENSISTTGKCHGIDFLRQEEKLIVSYCNPGKVEILNLDGVVDRQINITFNNPIYLSLNPNTRLVCVSDTTSSRSRCYSGDQLRYLHLAEKQKQTSRTYEVRYDSPYRRRILTPLGITTDNLGTSYICDKNNILVFSPTESYTENLHKIQVESEVLIDFSGKNISPSSISFCNRSFRLYIGMDGDQIKVYTVA